MMKKLILLAGRWPWALSGAQAAGAASLGQGARQDQRPGLAAKRRQAVRQLLPELPLGGLHALQPPADIGLTEEQIKDNLLFTTDKVGETMKAAIDPKQAKDWFGANPPDLTVIARSRAGAAGQRRRLPVHLPAHLLPRRHQAHRLEQPGLPQRGHAPRAVGTAGRARRRFRRAGKHGHEVQVFKGWEQITPGTHDAAGVRPDRWRPGELHAVDGRAQQNTRVRVGVWVLLFLGVFTVIAWRLNAAFWKDIK
jgi:ubiquinol-cytochrome c reductase cytochrome c1 subunit